MRAIRCLFVALLAAGVAGCGNAASEAPKPDTGPRYVRDQILLVPMNAEPDDLRLVERAVRTLVPGAKVRVADRIAPVRMADGRVDGRRAIAELVERHPTAGGPVMVLGVTSEDLHDSAVATNFAFLVRDRPQAILSTFRIRSATPGVEEDRVTKLVARLVGTVYFRLDEVATFRTGVDLGPFGRLDSLADLDQLDAELCDRDDPLDTNEKWNTRIEYRRQLGCGPVEVRVEPTQYPDRIAASIDECLDADGADCSDLAAIVRRDPHLGAFVDRATRIRGATCSDACVFAVQLDAFGEPVIRSWVGSAGQSSLHTYRPGSTYDRTCVGDVGITCPAEEPACLDPALLAWVQRARSSVRRGPIPGSATRTADC